MQNLVYEWVEFSKSGQIWAKIGSNLRKFWKKLVILFKIWPKIGPIGMWMGYFFLKNWYMYGSTFNFCGGTSLPKPNSTPLPPPPVDRPNLTVNPVNVSFTYTSWLSSINDGGSDSDSDKRVIYIRGGSRERITLDETCNLYVQVQQKLNHDSKHLIAYVYVKRNGLFGN